MAVSPLNLTIGLMVSITLNGADWTSRSLDPIPSHSKAIFNTSLVHFEVLRRGPEGLAISGVCTSAAKRRGKGLGKVGT